MYNLYWHGSSDLCKLVDARRRARFISMLHIFNVSLIGRVDARRRARSERAFRLIAKKLTHVSLAIAILLVFISNRTSLRNCDGVTLRGAKIYLQVWESVEINVAVYLYISALLRQNCNRITICILIVSIWLQSNVASVHINLYGMLMSAPKSMLGRRTLKTRNAHESPVIEVLIGRR